MVDSDEAREQILEDIADGVQSHTVDGTTTTMFSPKQRLEALREAVIQDQPAIDQPHFGLRFSRLIPPGGGGD